MASQVILERKAETVAVPPLTAEFNAELRRLDYREHKAVKRASDAHLEDLRREHELLRCEYIDARELDRYEVSDQDMAAAQTKSLFQINLG